MKKRYLIIMVMCLIIIISTTSYAYFKTRIKGDGSTISITGGKLNLVINENKINLTNQFPIYDTQKDTKASKNEFSITLSGSGVTKACYNLYLDVDNIGTNLQNRFLKYELSDGTNKYVGNFDGVASGTKILMVRNESLSSSSPSKNYTLRLWLSYSETEDQSFILTGDEASRTFEGKLHITGTTGKCQSIALEDAILEDNKVVPDRTNFSKAFTEETTGTIYQTNKTEDGSTVYYYSGATANNWVKFGKYSNDDTSSSNLWKTGDDIYWRIIRTNEDGSIRLLYAGTSPDTTKGYIGGTYVEGTSSFNSSYYDPMYAGYMYGTSGSLENNRTNTNDSVIKSTIDNWYKNNLLTNYDKYISKTAIFCNDRSIGHGTYSITSGFMYGPRERSISYTPTYKCGGNKNGGLFESTQALADKFSVSTEDGGNGQLTYPVALMTVDEATFAGGKESEELKYPYIWYYTNSQGESITGGKSWWTLSPSHYNYSSNYNEGDIAIFIISDFDYGIYVTSSSGLGAVRPALSLLSCVKVTGNGTSFSPYEVDYEGSCK